MMAPPANSIVCCGVIRYVEPPPPTPREVWRSRMHCRLERAMDRAESAQGSTLYVLGFVPEIVAQLLVLACIVLATWMAFSLHHWSV